MQTTLQAERFTNFRRSGNSAGVTATAQGHRLTIETSSILVKLVMTAVFPSAEPCRHKARCPSEALGRLFEPLGGPEALVFVIDRSAIMCQIGDPVPRIKGDSRGRREAFPSPVQFPIANSRFAVAM